MEECKALEMDPYLFVYYIQGFLLPHFEKLRAQGKLHEGDKKMELEGYGWWWYTGELDANNNACGVGEAINAVGEKWFGTFLDDKPQGIRKSSFWIDYWNPIRCIYQHNWFYQWVRVEGWQ